MNDTLTYSIGPASNGAIGAAHDSEQPWFAISGPAQLQSSEMAARIAYLERKVAVLEGRAVPSE